MRRLAFLLAVAGLIIGLVGVTAAQAKSEESSEVTCNNGASTFPGTFFNGTGKDYTVGEGQTCYFTGFARNIEVEPGGSLVLRSANIQKDVRADEPGYIGFWGNVLVGDDVWIDGTQSNPSSLQDVNYQSGANYICETSIGGNLTVKDSSSNSPWNIGDASSNGSTNPQDDQCGAKPNNSPDVSVQHNVSLTNNQARMDFSDSSVGHNLLVRGNTGGTFLDGLDVNNEGLCQNNSPAATSDGDPRFLFNNNYGDNDGCP